LKTKHLNPRFAVTEVGQLPMVVSALYLLVDKNAYNALQSGPDSVNKETAIYRDHPLLRAQYYVLPQHLLVFSLTCEWFW
jgi:hypothetical protein